MSRYIDADIAIQALWNALLAYEDKTKKQFLESDELDVWDWIQHRIYVQEMSDIDRKTILDMPTADVVAVVRCKDCKYFSRGDSVYTGWTDSVCTGWTEMISVKTDDFCSYGEVKE